MKIDTSRKSPNFHSRGIRPVQFLVVHATAGTDSLGWLTSKASGVSAHYLISKTGKIWRMVDESQAAWHAGVSRIGNMADINERSIGIELENTNTGKDLYPEKQMMALLGLSREIVRRYKIPREHVVRHKDIAIPRGRKSDPAGFPWAWYLEYLYDWQIFRVRLASVWGARIREQPTLSARVIGGLWPLQSFTGQVTQGEAVKGVTTWIRRSPDEGGGVIHWSNLELVS